MSRRDGDTFYPHHPDTVPAGDYCVNNRPGDTFYLVVDEMNIETAWDILNEVLQATSWHIHPAIINYIAQFIIKWIDTEFKVNQATTNFKVCPVVTNFVVSAVIDDNVSIKESNIDMSFSIVPVKYTFTLKRSITSNFKIYRVMDNTRTP
jgi:hypothetical protein